MSMRVPPMIENEVSRGPRIPVSMDNLISDVRAVGNGNISSVLIG